MTELELPFLQRAEATLKSFTQAEADADRLQRDLDERRAAIRTRLNELVAELKATNVQLETQDFEAFLREPYCIVPIEKDEWRVIVPRWVDFHVGMLERSTQSYNVFRVNKWAKWLGEVPSELERLFAFKETVPAVVQDGEVHVRGAVDQDEIWERYSSHLVRREGKTKLKIREGAEFRLISEMINDGTLPFVPKAVRKEHLRDAPAWLKFDRYDHGTFIEGGGESRALTLRPYQERAWREFLQRGAIGVYWPMGAGKTVFGLTVMAHLKGPHLIVVPTTTLVEQWTERIRKHLAPDAARQVVVVTYQGFDKVRDRKWATVGFDECHVLPANTFSRFSTLVTEYRYGLSATPYREDGRTDLIFALTGWPVGLDWNELIELGVVKVPTITLSVTIDEPQKTARLERLLKDAKRTIVFCDGIDKGTALSRRFGCEFVHGATTNRLETIRHELKQRGLVLVSRVGDEGLSLPELERVIEVDYHAGSRRQEGQRLGRLFHADAKGEHWILMTKAEHDRYEKRLLAIREKGFRIKLDKEVPS